VNAEPRRSFIKTTFSILSSFITLVVGAPVVVAFLDPSRRQTVKSAGGSRDYGKLADLPVGVPQRKEVISARMDAWDRSNPQPIGAIWLVRRSEDRVDAYSVVCPHLGCPVGFDAAQRVFACPCHDSAFSLADGSRMKGPSPRGLDPLPVEIEVGKIHVTYKRFVQGIRARREG
jgi:Rieske Fe-S protein